MIQRPLRHGADEQEPNRIIVHSMCEFLNHEGRRHAAAEFLDAVGLSAHVLVSSAGTVIRCREDDQGAWHAKGHNTNTLGIEFLVPHAFDYVDFVKTIARPWVGAAQLAAGVRVVAQWCRRYGITRIERHSDVDPGRKVDPGSGFPWEEFLQRVTSWREAPQAVVTSPRCSLSDW